MGQGSRQVRKEYSALRHGIRGALFPAGQNACEERARLRPEASPGNRRGRRYRHGFPNRNG